VTTKEPVIDDFGGRLRRCLLLEIADHKDGDVVAARDGRIEEHAVKLRGINERNIGLLKKFALERLAERLTNLDPATGQMPARHIAVLDQKNPTLPVDHGGSHPQGQPT